MFHSSVTVETYVGYDRAENFILPGGAVQDGSYVYAAALNEWRCRETRRWERRELTNEGDTNAH